MGDNSIDGLVGEIISPIIVDSMLAAYSPNSSYIEEARYISHDHFAANALFRIPETCYGDKTGHFNAVEFILCYNQLIYVMFSEAVEQGDVPEMGMTSFEEFKKIQLKGSFLTKIKDVSFRRQINPEGFVGRIDINKVKSMRGTNFYFTNGSFADFNGGRALGEMNYAFTP